MAGVTAPPRRAAPPGTPPSGWHIDSAADAAAVLCNQLGEAVLQLRALSLDDETIDRLRSSARARGAAFGAAAAGLCQEEHLARQSLELGEAGERAAREFSAFHGAAGGSAACERALSRMVAQSRAPPPGAPPGAAPPPFRPTGSSSSLLARGGSSGQLQRPGAPPQRRRSLIGRKRVRDRASERLASWVARGWRSAARQGSGAQAVCAVALHRMQRGSAMLQDAQPHRSVDAEVAVCAAAVGTAAGVCLLERHSDTLLRARYFRRLGAAAAAGRPPCRAPEAPPQAVDAAALARLPSGSTEPAAAL
eukprot:TRINITY_DN6194_c0_g3_i1.p1 TRINITY_DN6194_c0_g3~~TRINITY_DN6194_c0_g3_i1.p1  ORF type:complete len:329 (+),score=80.97 TRINITY_DN6194_c0_g3_i1:69-989(+)